MKLKLKDLELKFRLPKLKLTNIGLKLPSISKELLFKRETLCNLNSIILKTWSVPLKGLFLLYKNKLIGIIIIAMVRALNKLKLVELLYISLKAKGSKIISKVIMVQILFNLARIISLFKIEKLDLILSIYLDNHGLINLGIPFQRQVLAVIVIGSILLVVLIA